MAHQHMKAISARNVIVLIIKNKLIYYDSKFKKKVNENTIKKLKFMINTNFFYIINNRRKTGLCCLPILWIHTMR